MVDSLLDDPGRPGEREGSRLITTIADPERAPAAELAAPYRQRWELEGALDELKTHQRGPGVVLRSRDPDGVRQEVWAHLLVHYAIRTLIHQAALDGEVDPDRLSLSAACTSPGARCPVRPRFPLGGWPGRPGRRSLRRCGTCWPHAGCGPGRGSSSAR